VAPPVFKTGLAGIALAGRFDSFPPPPISDRGRVVVSPWRNAEFPRDGILMVGDLYPHKLSGIGEAIQGNPAAMKP
jgi:hypothetical protein